ncbi:RNA polymerase sigma factor [Paenibacillus sp. BAC0078]
MNQQWAEAVLKEHGNAILRLAHSYLHNMADAEDMLQEALLQMLRKAPAFDNPDHEKAWLFRVTINLCKNKIKYNQRRRWEDLSESLACEVREDLTFVWEAVSSLPVKYREVIHLFYQEDLSTAQIASLLKKQDSTIRSLLHRARLILKEQLMEVYDFEE